MSIDVNTQFHNEKTAQLTAQRDARDAAIRSETDQAAWLDGQVAAGRMVQISPTAYRVTQGWDAGEVFTVTRTADRIEIVANHGLDTTVDGAVSLYSAVPAWHGLGTVIPGGTTDIDEVMRLARIGFNVELAPAMYPWLGEMVAHTGQFHTVRTDTGTALGVVGSQYRPIQNRQGFEFLQSLVADTGVTWESAGALRGGRRVFISIRLPETVTVDATGINDQIVPFVVVINSHDGHSPFQALVTPWRPVCANTERFAVRDAHTRWSIRHTAGATDQITEARRTLGLSLHYYEQWAAEETALARTDLAITEFTDLIADLWPIDADPTTRALNNAAARTETLVGLYRSEADRVGRTAYAAERAVTDYLDHVAPRRPGKTMTEEIARATALLEGADDDIKARAHRRLMLTHATR